VLSVLIDVVAESREWEGSQDPEYFQGNRLPQGSACKGKKVPRDVCLIERWNDHPTGCTPSEQAPQGK